MNGTDERTGDHPARFKIQEATVIRNGNCVLDRISLDIHEGDHTAILGPNGSGKSSLIKLVIFQHYVLAHKDRRPCRFGKDLWDVFQLRTMLGIVSADLHHIFTAGVSLGRLRGLEAVLSEYAARPASAAPRTRLFRCIAERLESGEPADFDHQTCTAGSYSE